MFRAASGLAKENIRAASSFWEVTNSEAEPKLSGDDWGSPPVFVETGSEGVLKSTT